MDLAAIWRCRYFWLSLVRMDLRARYRRSVLGLGWSLLHPIAMTLILCLVFHRIFHVSARDYAPSLLVGLAFWNYFTTATTHGCTCFFTAEPYIRQYPSPLAIFPLRVTLGAGVHFLVALAVAVVLAMYLIGLPGPLAILSLVPTLVLLFALGWAMALLGGLTTVLFRDAEYIANVGFQILFYATPIIYTDDVLRTHRLEFLMYLNPLVAFLQLLRTPIIKGCLPDASSYAIACGTVLVLAGGATFFLRSIQRKFIFYL